MTQVLIIVGVVVFFISVYGAVVVGGHLLTQLERAESDPDTASRVPRSTDQGGLSMSNVQHGI